MKAMLRRLRRLELQCQRAAAVNESGPSAADVLRERRRRRLESEGLPPDEPEHYLVGGSAPLSCAEMLRLRFKRPNVPVGGGRIITNIARVPWPSGARPSARRPSRNWDTGQVLFDWFSRSRSCRSLAGHDPPDNRTSDAKNQSHGFLLSK
jgi:hypothetical protein